MRLWGMREDRSRAARGGGLRRRIAAWCILVCLSWPGPMADAAELGGPAFWVAGFRFTGNTVFSDEELARLAADRVGTELTLAAVEEVARRTARFYRERGYPLAVARVPPQEVVGGIVEIAITEGRYAGIILQYAEGAARLPEATVHRLLGRVRPGTLIEAEFLERAIQLLGEIPGIAVQASLRSGDVAGTAYLVLSIEPADRAHGRIGLGNTASEYLGRLHGFFALALEDPTGRGDRLSVQWVAAGSQMHLGRVSYDAYLPAPWRWEIAYSDTHYALGAPFDALNAHGTASHVHLSSSYPLHRSGRGRADLTFQFTHKNLTDSLLGEERTAEVQAFSATWRGEKRPRAPHGAARGAWATLTAGRHRFLEGSLDSVEAHLAGPSAQYATLRAGFSSRLPLSSAASLDLSASGQWSSHNLVRSEKFSLGGPDGLRAYPAGEAGGDLGWLVRGEIRSRLGALGAWGRAVEVTAFADAGRVALSKSPAPGTEGENHRTLAGFGIGLAYVPDDSVSLRLEYAVPVGGPENLAASARPRLWARLESTF